MEQVNNRIKQENNKNTVGVDAHIDPLCEETVLNNCRGDFNRPFFEGITKSNKAITLVTLIITIIIMLILTGVMISITTDEDDVFDMAEDATAQWNNRITTEDNVMQNLLAKRNEILGGTQTPETPTSPAEGTITLNKSSLTLEIVDGVNSEETLTATKQNLTGTVSWTSSTPTVATVDANGKVTTVGAGTTIITASCDGKTATCEVTVTTKTTPKVTLSATTGKIEVDATLVLTASLNVTPTQNIVWTSSDDTIATVVGSGTNNITGTITGVKAGGPVTITAKYGDKTATCSVTVKEKSSTLISFEVEVNFFDTVTFQAEENMDWATWCSSSYNTLNFDYDEDGVVYYGNLCFCDSNGSSFGLASRKIIAGERYYCEPY